MHVSTLVFIFVACEPGLEVRRLWEGGGWCVWGGGGEREITSCLKSRLCSPPSLSPPHLPPLTSSLRLHTANECLAAALMPDLCSLYVPLAAPSNDPALRNLHYRSSYPFHSAAILASAIDSVTQAPRLVQGGLGWD